MKNKSYMLFLLLLLSINYGQSLVQVDEFGNFNQSTSFTFTTAGFFYVADKESNEIVKIDTLGNIQKIIGGYGWSQSTFDFPADVYTNILNVFVADYNNNRIQTFDKDLNFLYEIKNDKINFRYPTGVATSNQGDIFILDSDNKRIIKLNSKGEFQNSIGDFDAGEFQLSSPEKFCVDDQFNLIVINKKQLFIFDQFGTGLNKIKLDFNPININSFFGNIVLVDSNAVYLGKLNDQNEIKFSKQQLKVDNEINDALLFNSKLYVLTNNSILVYQVIGNSE